MALFLLIGFRHKRACALACSSTKKYVLVVVIVFHVVVGSSTSSTELAAFSFFYYYNSLSYKSPFTTIFDKRLAFPI